MKKIITGLVLFFLVAAITAPAQDEFRFQVNEFTLKNGMTFLVVERPTAPVFSGVICAGAGSALEKQGAIGTAHLLEHMMFKGSRMVGTSDYESEKDFWIKEDSVWARLERAVREERYVRLNHPEKLAEHQAYIESLRTLLDSLAQASSQYVIQNEFDLLYSRQGAADFNASTAYDFTHYYVSLPSNRLELWFNMESDRLKYPAFREFFTERAVVSEERRLSVENESDAKLFEQLIGTAFIAHPYQLFWEWQSEVNNLTRQDMADFFNAYYTPQNLTAAIVGDVKTAEVQKLAEKYFADIPVRPDPDPIYTEEIPQTGERRVEVHFEANPALIIAYHKTSFDSPDEPAFRVIERLLGEGRTSRLYKSLVLDKQICLSVSVDVFPGNSLGDKYPGVFNIYAYPKEGISSLEVEQAIYEELNKLVLTPVDSKELTKIKNNIDADFIWYSYNNMGLAYNLATTVNLAKDWRYLSTMRKNLLAVTPADIQRVAGQYFTETNRTVATLVPTEKGEAR